MKVYRYYMYILYTNTCTKWSLHDYLLSTFVILSSGKYIKSLWSYTGLLVHSGGGGDSTSSRCVYMLPIVFIETSES